MIQHRRLKRGLIPATLFLLLVPTIQAVAQEPLSDRFTVSYYHQFSGMGGPKPLTSYSSPYYFSNPDEYFQNQRGIEFGYRRVSSLCLHLRVEQHQTSERSEIDTWYFDSLDDGSHTRIVDESQSGERQITLDAMIEPLYAKQTGPVRAIIGIGPFFSYIQSSRDITRRTDYFDTDERFRRDEATVDSASLLIGLRGVIGAEWWFKNRIALVCQTGFETALFSSIIESDLKQTSGDVTEIDQHGYINRIEENGWQIYNLPVMLGVRVQF